MSLELLKPVSENLLEELDENHLQGSLFNKIKFHRDQSGIPDIDSSNLCIIGISETRNSYFESDIQDLKILRKELYKLKEGKWKISISDLGDLPNGNTVEDTYHALYDICKELHSKKITLVIIGGSNDIIYPVFKSFDSYSDKVNIVSIDNQFDLYQDSDIISGRTYMNKIILDDSNKLNDFTNIGYQRHLCSYKEVELMDKLFFEKISLGEISENLLDELDENHLQGSLFNKIKLHRDQSGIPDIDSSNLCIIGISETRNSYFESDIQDLNILRKELYKLKQGKWKISITCLLYTSPSPRDLSTSRMPSSA